MKNFYNLLENKMKKTSPRLLATVLLLGIAISSSFAQIDYQCYIVPVNGSKTILIENGKLYRLTIKSCWMSALARMGTYLIYGLDFNAPQANNKPAVLTTAETPSIDWTFSYSNSPPYSINMTITSNGWGDQGLWVGVEFLVCPVINDIGEIDPPNNSDRLAQNYPNPFNFSTKIEYTVQTTTNVQIKIYDSSGNLLTTIVNETKSPGEYSVVWNGKDDRGTLIKSGTYFYQILTRDFISSKKMILLK